MTVLETSLVNPDSRVSRVISLSPEALRACADTLDGLARNGCEPGESVLYRLTHNLTVIYKPNRTGSGAADPSLTARETLPPMGSCI